MKTFSEFFHMATTYIGLLILCFGNMYIFWQEAKQKQKAGGVSSDVNYDYIMWMYGEKLKEIDSCEMCKWIDSASLHPKYAQERRDSPVGHTCKKETP